MNAATQPLAEHFVQCSHLGRFLTTADDSRFLITDDFLTSKFKEPDAAAIAAIVSRDSLVAQSALAPLGLAASRLSARFKPRFEKLFDFIGRTAPDATVRGLAREVLDTGMEAKGVDIVKAEIDSRLAPARAEFKKFLGLISFLADGRMTPGMFRQEFQQFTETVAGRIEFGVYAHYLDTFFASPKVSARAKGLIAVELIGFPRLIRRELITNLLVNDRAPMDVRSLTETMVNQQLDVKTAKDIALLRTLKNARTSIRKMHENTATMAIAA